MTLKIVEGLLVGLLALISWVIWRRSFTRNLLSMVYRLLRFLLTYAAGWLTFKYALKAGYSPIISGMATLVVSFFVMFVLGFILHPGKHENKHRSLLNRLFQRVGNTFLILLLWLVFAVTVDLTATLLEHSRYREQVKSQSWLISQFMDWHESTNPLLNQLGTSRQWFYDKAGLSHLLEQVRAIRQIQQMDSQQRSELLSQNKNLKALLENPAMLKVTQSSDIQQLIQQASQGDANALMQLGKNPAINQLLSDPTLYKRLMAVDPSQLVSPPPPPPEVSE